MSVDYIGGYLGGLSEGCDSTNYISIYGADSFSLERGDIYGSLLSHLEGSESSQPNIDYCQRLAEKKWQESLNQCLANWIDGKYYGGLEAKFGVVFKDYLEAYKETITEVAIDLVGKTPLCFMAKLSYQNYGLEYELFGFSGQNHSFYIYFCLAELCADNQNPELPNRLLGRCSRDISVEFLDGYINAFSANCGKADFVPWYGTLAFEMQGSGIESSLQSHLSDGSTHSGLIRNYQDSNGENWKALLANHSVKWIDNTYMEGIVPRLPEVFGNIFSVYKESLEKYVIQMVGQNPICFTAYVDNGNYGYDCEVIGFVGNGQSFYFYFGWFD